MTIGCEAALHRALGSRAPALGLPHIGGRAWGLALQDDGCEPASVSDTLRGYVRDADAFRDYAGAGITVRAAVEGRTCCDCHAVVSPNLTVAAVGGFALLENLPDTPMSEAGGSRHGGAEQIDAFDPERLFGKVTDCKQLSHNPFEPAFPIWAVANLGIIVAWARRPEAAIDTRLFVSGQNAVQQ